MGFCFLSPNFMNTLTESQIKMTQIQNRFYISNPELDLALVAVIPENAAKYSLGEFGEQTELLT